MTARLVWVLSEYPRGASCQSEQGTRERLLRPEVPGARWFDVALWHTSTSLWPEWIGVLAAADAYSAVMQLMHTYGRSSVWRASARALDGSIWYRAFGVRDVPRGFIWFSDRKWREWAAADAKVPSAIV